MHWKMKSCVRILVLCCWCMLDDGGDSYLSCVTWQVELFADATSFVYSTWNVGDGVTCPCWIPFCTTCSSCSSSFNPFQLGCNVWAPFELLLCPCWPWLVAWILSWADPLRPLWRWLLGQHQKQHYVPYYLSNLFFLSLKYAFGIISMFFTLVRCSIILSRLFWT